MELDEENAEMDIFLKNIGIGRRSANDPLFQNSHDICQVFERKGVVIEDEEELCHNVMKEFQCQVCDASFQNLLEYDLHYDSAHHFVCAECKKARPTERLLEIHIQETHDSFFKVLMEKQPMYQCFLSECNSKFKDPVERKEHCRDIHLFPKNYRFEDTHSIKANDITKEPMEISENEPVNKKESKVKLGKNSRQKTFSNKCLQLENQDAIHVDHPQNSTTVTTKMSSVTMFIPRQVQMQQKSYAKLLTKNQEMETNVLETDTLMELRDSLPTTDDCDKIMKSHL